MEVTTTGWVFILIGLACFHRPMWLTVLVVASVTFSATAVINVPSLPFGMQPYHWFGLLLVLSTLVLRLPRLMRAASPLAGTNRLLYPFLAWGIVATVVTGAKGTSVAHMVHLLLGASVMGCIVANTTRLDDLMRTVRALVYGTLLASAWGIFELTCSILDIPYPDFIFNNSVGEFVSAGSALFFFGLRRLNSVATEPSYLVRSLVPVLCLLMGLWLHQARTRATVEWLHPMGWKVGLLVAITLLSTSALGIVSLALAGLIPLLFARHARLAIASCYLAAALLVLYVASTNPLLLELADEVLFGKLESGSGTDRLTSVADAYGAFLSHPIVGAGPGLVTSHDLLLKLLSNFGMVGALLFLLVLMSVTWRALRWLRRHRDGARSALCLGLIAANLMLWIMDGLAGVSYQYGIFWALLGLLISASRAPRSFKFPKASLVKPLPADAPGFDHHHRAQ